VLSVDAAGPSDEYFVDGFAPFDHVENVVQRPKPQNDVDIGQTQVGVENQNLLALLLESDGDIGDEVCLANSALPARDRNDSGFPDPVRRCLRLA